MLFDKIMANPQKGDLKVIKECDKSVTAAEFLGSQKVSDKFCNFQAGCVRRPKIANNIREVRNIIKLRKKLKQISKVNKCLDKCKTIRTENNSNSNKELLKSWSSETKEDIDTSQPPATDLSNILYQTTNEIKVKGVETECTRVNSPLKNCAAEKLSSDVYIDNLCANINSCENLDKEEINEFNNSDDLSVRVKKKNSLQCSQKSGFCTYSTNETLLNHIEKLPIQSNIIDSAHDINEMVKTVPFNTCAANENVPNDILGSIGDFQNTKCILTDSNDALLVSNKSGKKKKLLHQDKQKVKSSSIRKCKLEKNINNTSIVAGNGNFQVETRKSSSTLIDNIVSPFLYNSLDTYMMNVQKPVRTYTRKNIKKMDTDKIMSSVVTDKKLQISDGILEVSTINESKPQNSEATYKPSATCNNDLKMTNGESAAAERKLYISDSTKNRVLVNNDKGEASGNMVISSKLNIGSDLKIPDGKLKISLNTNVPSDLIKASNATCLQLPRNIVLKIVKPATSGSNGENSEVQLISVNNVKLVLNPDSQQTMCNSSSPLVVNIQRTTTTEDERVSDKINLVVPQIGCSSQGDALTEEVSKPTLTNQQKLFNIQEKLFNSLTVPVVSVSLNRPSESSMPERSQQPIIDCKESKKQDAFISGLKMNKEEIFHDSVPQKKINNVNISSNSSDKFQLVKTKLLSVATKDAILEDTDKVREMFPVDNEDLELSYTCRKKIQDTAVNNKEQMCSNVISSHDINIKDHKVSKLKKSHYTHLEHLKIKKCYKVQEYTKKFKKRKYKRANFVENTEKISVRSGFSSKNMSYRDQAKKRTDIHEVLNDADIIQEEYSIDGADISVKLAITRDGIPKIIKPKIAKNIIEARKIIKIEKKLQQKIKKILKNKHSCTNIGAELKGTHEKQTHKQVTLADLLASPFDTSKNVVPDFLLPKVCIQPLDLNSIHRATRTYNRHAKKYRRQKIISQTEDNNLVFSGEYGDSVKSDINLNFNDSCDNNNYVSENCVLNFDEHKFHPSVIGKKPTQIEKSLPNFDVHISSPVRVEEIPQCDWLFPHSLTTDHWMF